LEDRLHFVQSEPSGEAGCCVAAHCAAGLGRGLVAAALALTEGRTEYKD
ncbi:hypothetical protein DBR06_SOUSAS1410049, partial [Sousa chinensis]